jgi:hypothetical protein
MAFYRMYFIDAAGRFVSADDGVFVNDADALAAAAAKLASYSAIEVWTGSRLVGKVSGETGEQPQGTTKG